MGLSLPGMARFIRRWWLALLLVPLVTGAIALAIGLTRTPMYASSSTLLVTIPPSNALDGYNANLLAQDLSATYQTLITTDPVLQPVAAANPPLTTDELRGNTTATASTGALFTVTVVDPDPERAATLVNAIAAQFTTFVSGLSGPVIPEGSDRATIATVVAGEVAETPYAPRLPAWVTLGVIAGIVLVNVGILLHERLDTRIRTAPSQDWASSLARIPSAGRRLSGPATIFLDAPGADAAGEAIRQIRTAVMARHAAPGSLLVVASPSRGDGTTTVVANLATAIANTGKLVLLIDANLRSPRLHEIFQIANVHGLGSLLSMPDLSWKTSAIRVAPNLAVIPAGPVREHPADLLARQRFSDLLGDIANTADLVIIDTPALDAGNDAVAVATHAPSVLLVCRAAGPRGAALAAADAFLGMDADLLGIVVNEGGSDRGRPRFHPGWRFGQSRETAKDQVPIDASAVESA